MWVTKRTVIEKFIGVRRSYRIVTVRHMCAATAAAAPNYRGPTSAISNGNTKGEQAMYI